LEQLVLLVPQVPKEMQASQALQVLLEQQVQLDQRELLVRRVKLVREVCKDCKAQQALQVQRERKAYRGFKEKPDQQVPCAFLLDQSILEVYSRAILEHQKNLSHSDL